jgi:antitoxin VapB
MEEQEQTIVPTPLNIKDPVAYELASEIAEATGKSLTRVVVDSLRNEKARLIKQREIDRKKVSEIIRRVKRRRLPRSGKTPEEIIGYNEKGLLN